MRLTIFKSVAQFDVAQMRYKRKALQIAKARLCEAINARKQSETFPSWMEKEVSNGFVRS